MAPGISLRIIATALAPFAFGYLSSYLLRAVNAVVAPDLVADLSLTPAELGLLTSAYLLAFALFQLPLGILFDRYGPRTVLISRFLPIIRSAAPFLAGTAQMPIRTFLIFNGAGAVIWSVAFMAGGYFFGQIPFVEQNIGIIVPVLGAIVAIPLVLQVWQSRRMAAGERDGMVEES